MNIRQLSSMIFLAAACTHAASAGVITYRGDTTGQPTFNRPLEDLSGLSMVGTAVRYDTRTFSVTATGTYDFTSVAAFDPFLMLYGPGFSPVAPLSNALNANDDLVGFNSSGFSAVLTAGTTYTALMTGFENFDFGAYAVAIGGAGDFTPVASAGASPDVTVYSGNTTGDPTYNRPLEDLSALSMVGTATPYDVFSFTVDVSGTYDLTSSAVFDPFVTLYASSFDSNVPLANALTANDDLVGLNSSGFQFSLVAGERYFAVTSGFQNSDAGDFVLLIAGAGSVTQVPGGTPVPEPSTLALVLVGLGLVGGVRGRSSRTSI